MKRKVLLLTIIVSIILFCPEVMASTLCGHSGIKSVLRILGIVINAIKIVVPIILIVTAMVEFTKEVSSSDNKAQPFNLLVRKAIAAAAVFLVPTVVVLITNIVGSAVYDGFEECSDCISNPLSCEISDDRPSGNYNPNPPTNNPTDNSPSIPGSDNNTDDPSDDSPGNNDSENNDDNNGSTNEETYEGKYLSIFGDSISTYIGYSNSTSVNNTLSGNAVEYKGNSLGITSVNQTWWMQLANQTGMKLLVNNSSAGGRLSRSNDRNRSKQLHGNVGQYKDIHPDVVVIYIGINDIRNSQSLSEFEKYYREVINNVDNKNPKAQIYIMTHVPFTWTDNKFMVKSEDDLKILEQYNDVIRKIANESKSDNCYLVDYYKKGGITISNHKSYANDGLHPNASGMDKITSSIISSLIYQIK